MRSAIHIHVYNLNSIIYRLDLEPIYNWEGYKAWVKLMKSYEDRSKYEVFPEGESNEDINQLNLLGIVIMKLELIRIK